MPYNPQNIPSAPLPVSMMPAATEIQGSDLLLLVQTLQGVKRTRRMPINALAAAIQLLFSSIDMTEGDSQTTIDPGGITLKDGVALTNLTDGQIRLSSTTGNTGLLLTGEGISLTYIDRSSTPPTLKTAFIKINASGNLVMDKPLNITGGIEGDTATFSGKLTAASATIPVIEARKIGMQDAKLPFSGGHGVIDESLLDPVYPSDNNPKWQFRVAHNPFNMDAQFKYYPTGSTTPTLVTIPEDGNVLLYQDGTWKPTPDAEYEYYQYYIVGKSY